MTVSTRPNSRWAAAAAAAVSLLLAGAGSPSAVAAQAGTAARGSDVHLAVTTKTVSHKTTVTVRATGTVRQEYDAMTGRPLAAKYTEPMGTRIHWGDHSQPGGSDPGDVTCKKHAPLVKLPTFATTYTHHYSKAGTYRIHYAFGVCPDPKYPKGTVTRTLTVHVARR